MIEALLGSLLGGVFRIAPEVLKWLDRKGEREHELKLLTAEMEFYRVKGQIALKQTEAIMTVAEMDAIAAASMEQGQTARAAGKWIAGISALVRPSVTYAFVGTYFAVKAAAYSLAVEQHGEWREVLVQMWNKDDMAMLMLILTFWFVGRVWDKARGQ